MGQHIFDFSSVLADLYFIKPQEILSLIKKNMLYECGNLLIISRRRMHNNFCDSLDGDIFLLDASEGDFFYLMLQR